MNLERNFLFPKHFVRVRFQALFFQGVPGSWNYCLRWIHSFIANWQGQHVSPWKFLKFWVGKMQILSWGVPISKEKQLHVRIVYQYLELVASRQVEQALRKLTHTGIFNFDGKPWQMSIDQSSTLCPSVDFWLQLGILCFDPTDICRFNLPFVPGIAGVSIFLDRARNSYVDYVDQKWENLWKCVGVSCKNQTFLIDFLFLDFFSPRTDEGCLVYAAKRNILLVYLHRFWFTMRASSAGWCFAFLKIPQPNVGFATNGGRLNPQYPCPWLRKRWSHLVKTSRDLESLSHQTNLKAFNY